ncbi:MAG: DUF4445 domain-containing protein [Treponema sp.]|nr:DUF4445 domain-containing protein [Treponema sp.]
MKIITEGSLPEIPEPPADFSPSEVALAVDVGTTTVAVAAWSLSSRKILSIVAEKNAQSKYGSDVINRIDFAVKLPSGGKILHDCLVKQLEKMFASALAAASQKMPRGFRPHVKKIVVTGNSTMLSFAAGVSVEGLAAVPFTLASKFDFSVAWKEISPSNASVVPSDAEVYFPPVVGAFIGADTVCAMLAAGFDLDAEKPLLLADVGTNSEMALFVPASSSASARILCTSAAAGPAFEAANISCGMPSVNGAVDKVRIEGGKISVRTIGNAPAKGVCGSGLISSVSEFLRNGMVDSHGTIEEKKDGLGVDSRGQKIDLTEFVSVSQNDIRNLQLAKSAVKTGLDHLLSRFESLSPQKISGQKMRFFLAGGFGSRIDIEESVRVGLLPPSLLGGVSQIGNAALFGASAILFSEKLKEKARLLSKKSTQINLAAVPDFQQKFLGNIDFEFGAIP